MVASSFRTRRRAMTWAYHQKGSANVLIDANAKNKNPHTPIIHSAVLNPNHPFELAQSASAAIPPKRTPLMSWPFRY